MTEPTVEQKAEALARIAADRAARLALADAEEKTKLAVDRAVRDALVDRELHDHAQHLAEINGSQRDMASSLSSLKVSFDEMSVSNQAVAKYVNDQASSRFSKRNLWLMGIGAGGGYIGLIAVIVTSHP